MFDPWPDEPDEYSPESRWGNPERDLPSVPTVETEESEVDPHTLRTFWASVVVANVAVFGVSLGLMLWYFRNEVLLGGGLVVVGVLAGARTYAYYREFKDGRSPDDEGDEPPDPIEATDDEDDEPSDPTEATDDEDDEPSDPTEATDATDDVDSGAHERND